MEQYWAHWYTFHSTLSIRWTYYVIKAQCHHHHFGNLDVSEMFKWITGMLFSERTNSEWDLRDIQTRVDEHGHLHESLFAESKLCCVLLNFVCFIDDWLSVKVHAIHCITFFTGIPCHCRYTVHLPTCLQVPSHCYGGLGNMDSFGIRFGFCSWNGLLLLFVMNVRRSVPSGFERCLSKYNFTRILMELRIFHMMSLSLFCCTLIRLSSSIRHSRIMSFTDISYDHREDGHGVSILHIHWAVSIAGMICILVCSIRCLLCDETVRLSTL